MNTTKQNSCEYLAPNKTIEELLVFNDYSEGVFYLYNYKGTSFRLFSSKQKLDEFFDNASDEALISFSEMETALALFSQTRAFGSFVGTKEQGTLL